MESWQPNLGNEMKKDIDSAESFVLSLQDARNELSAFSMLKGFEESEFIDYAKKHPLKNFAQYISSQKQNITQNIKERYDIALFIKLFDEYAHDINNSNSKEEILSISEKARLLPEQAKNSLAKKELTTEHIFWDFFSDANNQFEAINKKIQLLEFKKETESNIFNVIKKDIITNPLISIEDYLLKSKIVFSRELAQKFKIQLEEYNYLVDRINNSETLEETKNIIISADMLKNKPKSHE